MKTINAAKFKAECLAILDDLSPEGIVITKHGKPVARVFPYRKNPEPEIGTLHKKITVRGDIFSADAAWDADAQS